MGKLKKLRKQSTHQADFTDAMHLHVSDTHDPCNLIKSTSV